MGAAPATSIVDISDGYLGWAAEFNRRGISSDLRRLSVSDLDGLRDLTQAKLGSPTVGEVATSIVAVNNRRVVATYQATAKRRSGGVVWTLKPDRAFSPAIGSELPADGNLERYHSKPTSRMRWARRVAQVAIDLARAADWSPALRSVGDAAGYIAAERSWRRSVDKRANNIFGAAFMLFALPGLSTVLTRRLPQSPEGAGEPFWALLGRVAHHLFLEGPMISTIESSVIPGFIVGVVGVVAALAIALAVRPRASGMEVAVLVQQLRWTAWAGWTISGVAAIGVALAMHLVVAKPGEVISWSAMLLTVAGAVAASVSAEGALDLALTNAKLIATRRRSLVDRRNRIIIALKYQPTHRQILLGVASGVSLNDLYGCVGL